MPCAPCLHCMCAVLAGEQDKQVSSTEGRRPRAKSDCTDLPHSLIDRLCLLMPHSQGPHFTVEETMAQRA